MGKTFGLLIRSAKLFHIMLLIYIVIIVLLPFPYDAYISQIDGEKNAKII